MNNTEFLNMYIENFNQMKAKTSYAAMLDINYNYIAIGDKVPLLYKKGIKKYIGLNFINDIPRPDWIKIKKEEIFQKVKNLLSPHIYISITQSDDYLLKSMLICVSPIINPNSNDVVGFDISGSAVDSSNIRQYAINNKLEENNILYTLTQHELDILYFKCQMYSDIEVTEILSKIYNKTISHKTVNNILRQQLYKKFGVYSLVALIEKARTYGISKLNLLNIANHNEAIIELSIN